MPKAVRLLSDMANEDKFLLMCITTVNICLTGNLS